MTNYSRKMYSGRGLRKNRDIVLEDFGSKACEICEITLERKSYPGGRLEALRAFLKRRTCGKYFDEKGMLQRTECLKKWMSIPENNGHYKGIMPKCKDCGKRVAYPDYVEKLKPAERCVKCFKKWARKTGHFIKSGKRLCESGFGFQKGKTWKEAFAKRTAKRIIQKDE